MRIALLLCASYSARSDLRQHPAALHDAKLVREKLTQRGFEFDVVEIPVVSDVDDWVSRTLRDRSVGPDDPVVVYVSAVSHIDDAGEISLEVDEALRDEGARRRVPLARVRTALNGTGVRGAAVLLDLVFTGQADALEGSEHVAAARRVFAPELSGYSMMCAVRSSEQAATDRTGSSAFTSLWVRTLDNPEARNAAGAVVVSRVIELMRDDPDLYTDVPSFALMAGRRDLPLFSLMAAKAEPSMPPPSSARVLSVPPSSPSTPPLGVPGLLAAAEMLFSRGEWDPSIDAFKKALLLMGEEKSQRRAEVYARLGAIKVSQRRRREAIINYRKALSIDPTHRGALKSLADLLHAEGEFLEAVKNRRTLLEKVESDDDRFDVLLALADDSEKARDLDGTVEALEQARALRTDDTAVLARLAQVYDARHEFGKVVDIKVAIARLKSQPEEVGRSLVQAGDFARERALDDARALSIYAEALEADPLATRAFDELLKIVTIQGDMMVREEMMLAQTLRLEKVGAHAAQADVWRALSELRRTEKGDPMGAIDALDRCVALLPTDVEARADLAELLAQVGEYEQAIQSLEVAAVHAPGRVHTYRRIFELHVKIGNLDSAFQAASVLVQLDEAELDEQLLYEQYHDTRGVRPTRPLDEESWQLLLPASHDIQVRAILSAVGPAAIEHKLSRLQQQRLLPVLDPKNRQDPKTSTVSLTRTFVWACTALDVPLPEIYVADDVPGGIAAVPALSPTALVGRSVLSGRTLPELAFLVARDLTYYRPEFYTLVLYPTLRDLTSLFLAAVRIVRPSLAVPESSRAEISELVSSLKPKLDDASREKLTAAVEEFEEAGGRVGLSAWAKSIELAATRAGLLLCGDLSVAASALQKDERMIDDLSSVDRMSDLLPFAVSSAYASLRDKLGISVQARTA